jgi:hypothetical protein
VGNHTTDGAPEDFGRSSEVEGTYFGMLGADSVVGGNANRLTSAGGVVTGLLAHKSLVFHYMNRIVSRLLLRISSPVDTSTHRGCQMTLAQRLSTSHSLISAEDAQE